MNKIDFKDKRTIQMLVISLLSLVLLVTLVIMFILSLSHKKITLYQHLYDQKSYTSRPRIATITTTPEPQATFTYTKSGDNYVLDASLYTLTIPAKYANPDVTPLDPADPDKDYSNFNFISSGGNYVNMVDSTGSRGFSLNITAPENIEYFRDEGKTDNDTIALYAQHLYGYEAHDLVRKILSYQEVKVKNYTYVKVKLEDTTNTSGYFYVYVLFDANHIDNEYLVFTPSSAEPKGTDHAAKIGYTDKEFEDNILSGLVLKTNFTVTR